MENIQIIFENEQFIILNKPSGVMVHGDGRTTEKTVVDFLLLKYPDLKEVGEPITLPKGEVIYRPGIVHRIDKETSGLLLVAKTQESFEFFKNLFKEREMKKQYKALVWGDIKEDGIVDVSIARSPTNFRQWSATRGKRGQERDAITEYKVVKRIEEKGQKFTLIDVFPKTGRTHQIRVHMKYLQRPLVCDSLYALNLPLALGFTRLALHAETLSFEGSDGMEYSFQAPLPEEFKNILA
jgi:23S rRNA pseudouridine1911/1915/1917 synthase